MITNIFYSELTYLVLSFLLTILIIAKFVWKRLVLTLESKVNSIRSTLDSLEKQKQEAEQEIERLKEEVSSYTILAEKRLEEAQIEAKKISEKYSKIIENVVDQKQQEYKETISKIKAGLVARLQNKIIQLIEQELKNKMKETKSNREIQDINIKNSLKMIENWMEK